MKKILLVFCCCLLLLPATAAAEFWVGGQLGSSFTGDANVDFKAPPLKGTFWGVETQSAWMTGVIVGYNFGTTPGSPEWAKYFGAAIDFSYNGFSQAAQTRSGSIIPRFITGAYLPQIDGYQVALSFLARAHYPLMHDATFPRGRLFPYVMVGPAIVWTTSDFSNYGGGTQTSANVGLVTEVGLEYFIVPNLSIGPAFRYRHTWNPAFDFRRTQNYVSVSSQGLDQFMAIARISYHF